MRPATDREKAYAQQRFVPKSKSKTEEEHNGKENGVQQRSKKKRNSLLGVLGIKSKEKEKEGVEEEEEERIMGLRKEEIEVLKRKRQSERLRRNMDLVGEEREKGSARLKEGDNIGKAV